MEKQECGCPNEKDRFQVDVSTHSTISKKTDESSNNVNVDDTSTKRLMLRGLIGRQDIAKKKDDGPLRLLKVRSTEKYKKYRHVFKYPKLKEIEYSRTRK
ncbi:hypothetical protein J6590_004057 [Homalodisca vitripennis]|nr:hypothetical protein J6590_004057 [Homalodisca vitripennis]